VKSISRTSIKRVFACGLLTIIFCACSNQQDSSKIITHISASSIVNSNLPPTEKSEELAKAAELLLTAEGFSQASDLSKLALKQDPNNLRAGFIQAVTAPLVLQKGILARLRPFAQKNPVYLQELDKQISSLKSFDAGIANFLLDGQADISNEAQVQEYLDLTIQSLSHLRKFLKANLDAELTIRATSLLAPDLIERYASACELKTTETYEYELVCPSATARFSVTLNRADFDSLRAIVAYGQTYLILATAYDLSGATDSAVSLLDQKNINPQMLADSLLSLANFGHLRKQNKLSEIKSMGLDLVSGLNWAMSHQDLLCPKGQQDNHNRVGKLLNTGLCFGSVYQPYVEMLDTFLKGNVMSADTTIGGTPYVVKHQGILLMTNPIKDLRSLGPLRFNTCGQLQSVGDATIGGALPNGDFNEILRLDTASCTAPGGQN
jgi:hypothetical protein